MDCALEKRMTPTRGSLLVALYSSSSAAAMGLEVTTARGIYKLSPGFLFFINLHISSFLFFSMVNIMRISISVWQPRRIVSRVYHCCWHFRPLLPSSVNLRVTPRPNKSRAIPESYFAFLDNNALHLLKSRSIDTWRTWMGLTSGSFVTLVTHAIATYKGDSPFQKKLLIIETIIYYKRFLRIKRNRMLYIIIFLFDEKERFRTIWIYFEQVANFWCVTNKISSHPRRWWVEMVQKPEIIMNKVENSCKLSGAEVTLKSAAIDVWKHKTR